MKSNFAIPFCKICFKPIKEMTLSSFLSDEVIICPACFKAMEPRLYEYKLEGFKCLSLYPYNEMTKKLIYDLKGCGDAELAEVFLTHQKSYLHWRYLGYHLVSAPSYETKDSSRGFNHVIEIFKCLHLPFINAISKNSDVKQSNLDYKARQQISKFLSWNEEVNVKDKKILFVDDIVTSGATAKASARLIKEHGAKEVRILSAIHTELNSMGLPPT